MAESETGATSVDEAIAVLQADANRFGQARVARVAGISNGLVCRMMKGHVPRKPDIVDKVISYASGANIELAREQKALEDGLALLRKDAIEHDVYQVSSASGLSVDWIKVMANGKVPSKIKTIDQVIAYASRRESIKWRAPSNSRIKSLAHSSSPEEKKAEKARKKVEALRRKVIDLIGYNVDTGLCPCGLSHASFWFMDCMTRTELKRFLKTGELADRKVSLLEEVLDGLYEEPDHGTGNFCNDQGSLEAFYGIGNPPWEIPIEEERDFLLDRIDVLESQGRDPVFDELFPGGKAAAVDLLEHLWCADEKNGDLVWWFEAPSWEDRRLIRMLCGCASPIEVHCATRIEYWRYVASHSLPEPSELGESLPQNKDTEAVDVGFSLAMSSPQQVLLRPQPQTN